MRNLTLSLVFFCFLAVAEAQVPNTVLEKPQKYEVPLQHVNYSATPTLIKGTTWQVLSDNAYNKTYTKPGGRTVAKTIVDFLDDFLVAEETMDYIHLIKDGNPMETGKLFEDYGWAAKADMLLWSHCLVSENEFIDVKAILVNTLDYIKNDQLKSASGRRVQFFKDANLLYASRIAKPLYDIYYVYKITPTAVLLGDKPRMNGDKKSILGWVSRKRITIWNHRIVLEPNWDKKAVSERRKNKQSSTFFFDVVSASRYRKLEMVSDAYKTWDKDNFDERKAGDWLRFPLLEEKNGLLKLGLFGQIASARDGNGNISEVSPEKLSVRVSAFRSEMMDFLQASGISEGVKNTLFDEAYQLYFQVYTPFQLENTIYPLYKRLVFMSRLDFSEMYTNFETLLRAAKSRNARNLLQKTWKELLEDRQITESKTDLMTMTFAEAHRFVFGLAGSGAILGNFKLKDLAKTNLISNDLLKSYTNALKDKEKPISKTFNKDNFDYSFMSNKKKYYWLDESLLP